jgi:hypothetical protein
LFRPRIDFEILNPLDIRGFGPPWVLYPHRTTHPRKTLSKSTRTVRDRKRIFFFLFSSNFCGLKCDCFSAVFQSFQANFGVTLTTVFWNVASCSLVEMYRRFRSACLWNVGKLLPEYTAQSPRRLVIFIFFAVITWRLSSLRG